VTTDPGRRAFLRRTAQGAGIAATGGLLWSYLLGAQRSAEASALRPPGALGSGDFEATCIKCGQCVTACPFGTLRLAPAGSAVPIGTPFFTPRDVPCYMCADIPCVAACPTGALDHALDAIEDARMGIATIDQEACLSWQGLRCEICYRECPVRNAALSIENHPRRTSAHALFVPIVHSSDCTGCGLCEHACPTEVAAIRIVPPALVKGRIGDHYRLGDEVPDRGQFTPPDQRPAPEDGAVPGLEYLNEGVS